MIYGYARCSTNESKQDINRQIKELKAAGADEVIFEYEHGDAKTKKQLQMLLDIAKEGDTIITLEVSRLSRSTQQLCELIEIIRAKHLRLVIVGSITIDCRNGQTDPMSEAFLQMAGVFSQLELAMISCSCLSSTVRSVTMMTDANTGRFSSSCRDARRYAVHAMELDLPEPALC